MEMDRLTLPGQGVGFLPGEPQGLSPCLPSILIIAKVHFLRCGQNYFPEDRGALSLPGLKASRAKSLPGEGGTSNKNIAVLSIS
jgi:hypothetical protein